MKARLAALLRKPAAWAWALGLAAAAGAGVSPEVRALLIEGLPVLVTALVGG